MKTLCCSLLIAAAAADTQATIGKLLGYLATLRNLNTQENQLVELEKNQLEALGAKLAAVACPPCEVLEPLARVTAPWERLQFTYEEDRQKRVARQDELVILFENYLAQVTTDFQTVDSDGDEITRKTLSCALTDSKYQASLTLALQGFQTAFPELTRELSHREKYLIGLGVHYGNPWVVMTGLAGTMDILSEDAWQTFYDFLSFPDKQTDAPDAKSSYIVDDESKHKYFLFFMKHLLRNRCRQEDPRPTPVCKDLAGFNESAQFMSSFAEIKKFWTAQLARMTQNSS